MSSAGLNSLGSSRWLRTGFSPIEPHHEEPDAFDRWRGYMVMVLDVAIGQCERRNLTAPVNMGASDLRPPDLVVALIEELQVTHNLEVRFPRNNQHALDMLFALQHFYLACADVDDAAREALGVSAAGAVA